MLNDICKIKNLPLAGLAGVAAYLTIVAQQTNELIDN